MARADYDLNEYASWQVKSYNGDSYTCKLWWIGTGASQTWIQAKDGMKLQWECENSQDKNSPILASKCTMSIMVESLSQQQFINALRTTYNEKDVWITIEHNNGSKLLWCGYLILDLEAREDVSFPYETTLVAIDGIATLKEVPFLREYTFGTTDPPEFPYTTNDTFANAGWRRLIGSGTSWLKLLVEATGQLLADDQNSGTQYLENYVIQTAVNWWNEDMNITPDVTLDPLNLSKINVRDLYKKGENNTWEPPSVYDVLKHICKAWNMRFFYWRHRFHFVQISEYNSDEVGASPYTNPVNIPTREYFYTGSLRTTRDYFGDTTYGLYFGQIESATSSTGLQKLSGTVYEAIPAVKKTNIFYREMAGANHFVGYPLFVTHNTLQTPTTWPTDNAEHEITQSTESNGQLTYSTFTDADTLAGWIVRIYASFSNSSNAPIKMETAWSMQAKPSTSNWGDTDNKIAYKYQAANYAEVRWQDIGTGISIEKPLQNNQQYIRDYIVIPANCTNEIVLIWDSSTTSTTNTTGNLFPTNTAFIGDWDFRFWTFTFYENDVTYPMEAQGYAAKYSHGRIIDSPSLQYGTNVSGTSPMVKSQTPTYYAFDYTDALDNTGTFISKFVPVKNTSNTNGVSGQQIQVTQDTSDTYTYNFGNLHFGDGSGANSTATLQVYDATAGQWVFVNEQGKWGKADHTYSGGAWSWSVTYNQKFQDLLGKEIMNNQSRSIITFNGSTVLSETNKFYSGSTKRKYVNPTMRFLDADGKKYMMMRSTFNLVTDEWNGEWVQMRYEVPSSVTTGTQDNNGEAPDAPGETA